MRIDDLDTPVPVIDLDRVEHNLTKMQAYCDRHGLRLRPRAVIDAGTKSLTSDLVATSVGPGYGMILGYPDAVIERLNEEHGIIDLSRYGAKPALGEQVAIVPNHVCVVSNLHDEVVLSRDGRVVDTWRGSRGGRRADTW